MNSSYQRKFKRAFRFVREMHKGQFRAGRAPVWHHLLRVSTFLDSVLDMTKEGSASERRMIPFAALGHDLLEDTKAKDSEVRAVFGNRGYELICGMTNRHGDKNVRPYVQQMSRSEEAMRLIKLADLYDNVSSVTCTAQLLGLQWIDSYFLPIVMPMWKAVRKTKFSIYKKSAAFMVLAVGISFSLLSEQTRRMRT